jgi:hypothetical protein
MRKLNEAEIETIVSLLKQGKPLPDDYKTYFLTQRKNMSSFMLARSGKKIFLLIQWQSLYRESRPSVMGRMTRLGRICLFLGITFKY